MRFETRQRVQGTIDEVESAMLDLRYSEFLVKHHGVLLEVQPMERREEGDRIHRKVRYRTKPVIDSLGPKKVSPEWFAFVETSTYDKKRREMTFTNVPTVNKIQNLLVNKGTLRLKSAGDHTERTVEGEIGLKLPFLLKAVAIIGERVIHAEGMKILDGDVPVLNRFIADVLRK
jgi:hypothetical protein